MKSVDKVDAVIEGELYPHHDAPEEQQLTSDNHHDNRVDTFLLKKESLVIQSVETGTSGEYDDDVNNPPGPNWVAFFTTASSLTLLFNSWMNVSLVVPTQLHV